MGRLESLDSRERSGTERTINGKTSTPDIKPLLKVGNSRPGITLIKDLAFRLCRDTMHKVDKIVNSALERVEINRVESVKGSGRSEERRVGQECRSRWSP